jgi:hypothetical protein
MCCSGKCCYRYDVTGVQQVYFKSYDGNLWYYFNDKENSTYPGLGQVSGANWNKSCITCGIGSYIDNYIAVEPTNNGKLFYTATPAGLNHLTEADWVNADNPLSCPGAEDGITL